MSDIKDSTTLFYNLKLKRIREPVEVFEKMAKSLKKSGAAKKWICEYSAEGFTVDFCDGYFVSTVYRIWLNIDDCEG